MELTMLKRLLSHIPSALPVGATDFHAWADSIIDLAEEFADRDSLKWVLTTHIQHLPQTKAYVPKAYFVRVLRKAAANQVAAYIQMEIKEAQENKRKQAEVTAAQEAVTNEQAV